MINRLFPLAFISFLGFEKKWVQAAECRCGCGCSVNLDGSPPRKNYVHATHRHGSDRADHVHAEQVYRGALLYGMYTSLPKIDSLILLILAKYWRSKNCINRDKSQRHGPLAWSQESKLTTISVRFLDNLLEKVNPRPDRNFRLNH